MSVSHNLLGSMSIARSFANPASLTVERDDFGGNTETGEIGTLGWSLTTITAVAAESETLRPGITRLRSSATQNTVGAMNREVTGGIYRFPLSYIQEMTWIVNEWNASITDIIWRVGLFDTTVTAPTNGIYIERLAADTNWHLVAKTSAGGGNEARTDTTVAVGTNAWMKFKFRPISATAWAVSVNGAAEKTVTQHVPAAATLLQPAIQGIPTTNNARDMGVDFYSLVATGPAR